MKIGTGKTKGRSIYNSSGVYARTGSSSVIGSGTFAFVSSLTGSVNSSGKECRIVRLTLLASVMLCLFDPDKTNGK